MKKIKNLLLGLSFLTIIGLSTAFGLIYTKNQAQIKTLLTKQEKKQPQVKILSTKQEKKQSKPATDDIDLQKIIAKLNKLPDLKGTKSRLQSSKKIMQAIATIQAEMPKLFSRQFAFSGRLHQDLEKIINQINWNAVAKKLFWETFKKVDFKGFVANNQKS